MRADVLVGSAVLHAAAVALFVRWLPVTAPTPARETAPTVDIVVVPSPAEPVEVVLAEPESDRLPAAAPAAPAGRARVRSVAGPRPSGGVPEEHAQQGTGHETAAGTEHESAPGDALMHMRGADLALAPQTAEHIAAGGEPLHDRARVSGKLEHVSGGGAAIHDRVTTVTVDPDGTAHFHDKPDVVVHFHSPIPHLDVKQDMHELGDALQEWYADPQAGTRYGPTADLSEVNKAVPGMCDTWGDAACDDPLAPEVEKRARRRENQGGIGFHGPADLTAYLYRKLAHNDPYASRKLRLLDDTRAERTERGEAFRAEQAARSAELMQKSLEALWASTQDPAARREALYELWSDCADDEAGARARTMVIGWIRAKLPAGSSTGYTADELVRLAPFSPYE